MTKTAILDSYDEAVEDIPSGVTIAIPYFASGGFPSNLVEALARRNINSLTVISLGPGYTLPPGYGTPEATKARSAALSIPGYEVSECVKSLAAELGVKMNFVDISLLFLKRMVKKVIATYPGSPWASVPSIVDYMYRQGDIELELMPQGTLSERLRAGGVGHGGFYTPVGVGTVVEEGKEKKVIQGKEYILELALISDYGFVRAHKADKLGNLIYLGTGKHFNPVMAMASRVTIAEVEEIVEPGEIDPDAIHTPGVFVQRLVGIDPEHDYGVRPKKMKNVKTWCQEIAARG